MGWLRCATASRSSARSASPTRSAATPVWRLACCARTCWRRRGTSPPRRSTTTWRCWRSGARDRVVDVSERPDPHDQLARTTERALAGNLERVGDKLAAQGKLFVRDRLALLL